jgi:hypothetical protein
LTTLAVYTAVRAAGFGEKPGAWQLHWWAFFGLALGLAVSSRINIAPLAAIINLSGLIWLVRRGYTLRSLLTTSLGRIDLQRIILGITLAAVVSLLTFRLAQPYAFADANIARDQEILLTGTEPGTLSTLVRAVVGFNPQWQANMEEIQRLQQPNASFPPANQWTDRAPILFPWTNMVLYGMGITAGLLAWVGFFWALWRIIKARPDWTAHLIPVVWSGAYFLFMGTRWVKSIRYLLPIYPTLLLLAAWAAFAVWDWARRSERRAQFAHHRRRCADDGGDRAHVPLGQRLRQDLPAAGHPRRRLAMDVRQHPHRRDIDLRG